MLFFILPKLTTILFIFLINNVSYRFVFIFSYILTSLISGVLCSVLDIYLFVTNPFFFLSFRIFIFYISIKHPVLAAAPDILPSIFYSNFLHPIIHTFHTHCSLVSIVPSIKIYKILLSSSCYLRSILIHYTTYF